MKKLEAADISFSVLRGTHDQIRKVVKKYNLPNEHPDSIQVLLVNGAQYCAGLNLQVTSDIVYMHKVTDPAVEAQIAGRAARVGRTRNLNIHYVLYENEYAQLLRQHPQE
jgi:SNF2 family DNA or RNA helicase